MTDLLARTAELIDVPSVSFNEAELVAKIEAELGALPHLALTRIGDNLIARTDLGRSQRLILAGHTDTVPPNNNHTARVDGDTLWGLGSVDMKGGLAVFLELAQQVVAPSIDLTYVFYAREEVAQHENGLREIVAKRPDLLQADCAVLGEPTDGYIEAGCQGALRMRVALAGKRAHTARPWMGRNAVHRLAPILADLAAYEARQPTIDGCEFREALQAVSVEGGVAGNVVPDGAMLRVHHRFAPDRSQDQAEAWLRAFLAPHLDDEDLVEVEDVSSACLPSLEHPILAQLVGAAPMGVRAKLGWTDVARFAELGVPATNFGPGDPTLAHAPNEHLERASIERVYHALCKVVTAQT